MKINCTITFLLGRFQKKNPKTKPKQTPNRKDKTNMFSPSYSVLPFCLLHSQVGQTQKT